MWTAPSVCRVEDLLVCPPKRIPKYEYGYFCPFPHRMLSFLEAACGGKLVNYQVVGTKTAEIAENPCFCLHPPSLFPSSLYFLSKRLLSPTRRVYETAESSTVVTSQHRDSRSASRIEKTTISSDTPCARLAFCNCSRALLCCIPPDARAFSRTALTEWGLHHLSAGSYFHKTNRSARSTSHVDLHRCAAAAAYKRRANRRRLCLTPHVRPNASTTPRLCCHR